LPEAQFDPGHGTGTWADSEELSMTLTYRGQKYQQNKEAVSQKHPQLNYRGLKYVK
jgi:hypothetical protein